MDAASYDQYLGETDDWLKVARAQLLTDLIGRHAPRRSGLALLEVGAGAGQNLPSLARFGEVDAIEINDLGRKAIRARQVARDVFADPIPFDLDRRYDVICAMDVIEHLVDDIQAVGWMAAHLHAGGLLIMSVPAYQWLFSDHDRALGHHRRYTRARLIHTLPAGLEVLTAAYFTHLAFPLAVAARGVFSLGQLLRRAAPAKQASPRNGTPARALGALQGFELALMRRGYRPPFGLSTFVVARAVSLDDA
ncbi:MAG: class I SAM-dependent methyltransferase [Dokdonella sp.]|uniref:class I SAM-dependent methyltransferase n=1 Tax=Dokdonella sp. TaxID=2291710 RepID=UPI003265FD90